MSDRYADAAAVIYKFLNSVSAESDAVTAKFYEHGNRLTGITKQRNPDVFDAVVRDSAADIELYAQGIKRLLIGHEQNLELLATGYSERIKSLDPAIEADRAEREAMRREAEGLRTAATNTKGKVTALRDNFRVFLDSSPDVRLTIAAEHALEQLDKLFSAYENLETFALKVVFAADDR